MTTALATQDAFRAAADPTRRSMLDMLAEGERTVGELCESFSLTQPAISQHLKVLHDAKLVSRRRDGRRRFYSVRAGPLREIYEWVAHYERFWTDKLDELGVLLDGQDGYQEEAER